MRVHIAFTSILLIVAAALLLAVFAPIAPAKAGTLGWDCHGYVCYEWVPSCYPLEACCWSCTNWCEKIPPGDIWECLGEAQCVTFCG
jgi:hypothetical protein